MKFITSLVLFTAALVSADSVRITNVHKGGNDWVASGAWNRGGDIRGIECTDGCRYHPAVPHSDWDEVCFDWSNNRGHWKVGGNRHCFRKGGEGTITSSAWLSDWDEVGCTW